MKIEREEGGGETHQLAVAEVLQLVGHGVGSFALLREFVLEEVLFVL